VNEARIKRAPNLVVTTPAASALDEILKYNKNRLVACSINTRLLRAFEPPALPFIVPSGCRKESASLQHQRRHQAAAVLKATRSIAVELQHLPAKAAGSVRRVPEKKVRGRMALL
jgi:hypothetical protein